VSKVGRAEDHPEEQLWNELDHVRAGMLGIKGSHSHMQPMGHMVDRENAKLWFFTSKSGDLFKDMGQGSHAHFCVIGKSQAYHACLMGDLRESNDHAKIEELWSDMTGAWFKGQDDPDLALLSFDLIDAAIWASTQNPAKFACEIQKAKHSDHEPDVGARAHGNFGAAGDRR
jgi:general stress protein 26